MKSGFTYVEISIVVVIIALLAAIAIPAFVKAKKQLELQKFTEKVSTVEKDREGVTYKIVKIDGCEYIDNESYQGRHVYTHKGNCLNSFHSIK